MTEILDDLIGRLTVKPAAELRQIEEKVRPLLGQMRWKPNPGPQTDAYLSLADVLLYGGEPGGGKSQLLLGLAFNQHKECMIFRRQYGDLDRIVRDALTIHGSREGFNGSPPPVLRLGEGHQILFRSAQRVGDEQKTMGDGRDLLAIDEATHFAESQVRFLMGWVRTNDPNQRCRTVLATNPPLRAEGLWVHKMFAPWLDPQYPDPAEPGELRWCVTGDEEGEYIWTAGPEPVEIGGSLRYPKSYTYIPASVRDNPYYVASGYQKELDNLPPEIRAILMGGFRTTFQDQPNQVIPTAWVEAANDRWQPQQPAGVPQCAIGVDASGGGSDPMLIAPRWDGWYAPLIEIKAKDIPMDRAGAFCAGQVVSYRKDNALVVIDMGGGYGGPVYERLKENKIEVRGYKGAEGTTRRSREGKLHFANTRSAAYWLFREALDPGQPGGSPIHLPLDPKLIADLTAPTFEYVSNGIKVEPKEDVCDRLGRSTDHGDAVVMAWYEGPRELTNAMDWMDKHNYKGVRNAPPQVIGSRRPPMSAGVRR